MKKQLLQEMEEAKAKDTFDLDQKYKFITGKIHFDWENREEIGKKIEEIYRNRRRAMCENPPKEEKPQRQELSEEEKEENKRLFNQEIGSYSESVLNGSYTE